MKIPGEWTIEGFFSGRPEALTRHIIHDRIEDTVEPRPGRWTHHVLIENETDFDENVREWLREAYRFCKK